MFNYKETIWTPLMKSNLPQPAKSVMSPIDFQYIGRLYLGYQTTSKPNLIDFV